jgi:hypothetical protein
LRTRNIAARDWRELGYLMARTASGPFIPPEGWKPPGRGFVKECRDIVLEFFPEALEKLEGLIEGSGLPRDYFEAWFLSYIPAGSYPGCTAVLLSPEVTEYGEITVGRSYHGPYFALPWREVRRIELGCEAVSLLGCTHNWVGISDCLNSKGLLCLVSALHYPSSGSPSPGIQWHILVDKVMCRCERCDEAVDLLRSARHLRPLSYLLADSRGLAAVVEASPEGSWVRRPKDGYLIATNHIVSEGGKIPPKGSIRRFIMAEAKVREWLRKGPGGEELIRSILSDHESGTCMGPHDLSFSDLSSWGTLWALIWRPSFEGFLLAPGHPCRTDFLAFHIRR